jgi:hypothetical protein
MMTFEWRSGLEMDDRDAGNAGLESTLTSQEPVKPEVVCFRSHYCFSDHEQRRKSLQLPGLGGLCESDSRHSGRGSQNDPLFGVTSVTEWGTHLGYYVPGREA